MTAETWSEDRRRKDFFRRVAAPLVDLEDLDPDLERVEATVAAVMTAITESDPHELHAQLALACQQEPARMAQVLMCAVAYINPNERLSEREQRIDEIAFNLRRIA